MAIRLCLIVARADNGVIGRDGGLPWHLSGDLRFFKATTMGKPVVMGRKTRQAIGRPLPGRANIVVTRDPSYRAEAAEVVHDLTAAIELAARRAEDAGAEEIMIIGGAEIYRQALALAERIYLTEVHLSVSGEASFPNLDPEQWREVSREPRHEDQPGGTSVAYDLVVLDRAG